MKQIYTFLAASALALVTLSNANAQTQIHESNGNVGIGTTTPESKLHVAGSILSTGHLTFGRGFELKITPFWGGGNTSNTHTIIQNGWRHDQDYTSIHAAGITTNTQASIVIKGDGNVGIGTTNPVYKLAVKGTIQANEVRVETGWADFVFEPSYRLRPLSEVETFIEENGHLPEVPSADVVKEEGIGLAEATTLLLQKIEELTLYAIEQEKKAKALEERLNKLENQK